MLPRQLTRLEVKLEDKEEYEQQRIKARQQQQQQLPGPASKPAGAAGNVQQALSQCALPAGRQTYSCTAHWAQPLGRPTMATAATPMEVEVKLRLPSQDAHDKLAAVLQPGERATYQQENYFFDGAKGELQGRRAVMRLRFYDHDQKAVITVKGKQLLVDGIGRASEVEEEVPQDVVQSGTARSWLKNTQGLMESSPLLQKLNKEWGIADLVCLGGFQNARTEYGWEGLTLELDTTRYEWGTLYELECETTEPQEARAKLEALLGSNNIPYTYSAVSKFANFINKTLD